jgi:hypothetical protein
MPPDENIHQENHFSQGRSCAPNSLLFELRKEKDLFFSLFGGSDSSI